MKEVIFVQVNTDLGGWELLLEPPHPFGVKSKLQQRMEHIVPWVLAGRLFWMWWRKEQRTRPSARACLYWE